MIIHAAHPVPTRSQAPRTRAAAPAPTAAEETPHSAYLRRWVSRAASRHGDLLETIAAAPRPARAGRHR